MDALQAIITGLNERLTTDATLQGFMGGAVRLGFQWAGQDEAPPYLQCAISVAPIAPAEAVVEGTYTLTIWDHYGNAGRVFDIRARLIALLDNRLFDTDTGEATDVRIFWRGDQPVPEPEPDWWGHEITFSLRYVRAGEVAAYTTP